jgi:hypothetical protein
VIRAAPPRTVRGGLDRWGSNQLCVARTHSSPKRSIGVGDMCQAFHGMHDSYNKTAQSGEVCTAQGVHGLPKFGSQFAGMLDKHNRAREHPQHVARAASPTSGNRPAFYMPVGVFFNRPISVGADPSTPLVIPTWQIATSGKRIYW